MLSDTIHKSNLPHFGTLARIEVKRVNKSEQDVTKEITLVQKNIDIARARNIPISDILVHDFLTSPLFDGPGTSQ